MYCKYCGKQIADDSVFCQYCGKSQTAISDKSDHDYRLTLFFNMILSFWHDVNHKIKKLHIYMQPKLHKFFLWIKRLMSFAKVLFVAYLLIASATWGYYTLQERDWNSYDESFIKSAIKTGTIDMDSAIAFYDLGNQHYAMDLFALEHRCSINHQDIIVNLLNNLADKGDMNSQLLLGYYYKIGRIYPDEKLLIPYSFWVIDKEKSSYWFYLAAKQGNSEAQVELGNHYMYGFGLKQDFIKSLYWTQKSATKGNAVAQWLLGNIYAHGLGYYVYGRHKWWFTGDKFASAGDSENYITDDETIKEILQKGPDEVIVPKDMKKALHYWKLASEQGLEKAKDNLQKIYDVEECDSLLK